MSDMEVREIVEPTITKVDAKASNDELDKLVQELAETGSKSRKPRKGEIVFEGPSAAEQAKAQASEKASPLVDAAGRSRWVARRLCWCDPSAKDECRFHSPSEPGWDTCPSQNSYSKPRKLWSTNPEFGKARDVDEALAETSEKSEEESS